MGIFDILKRKKKDTVVIPEGHEVVVVSGGASPALSKMDSGVWIADFGAKPEFTDLDMLINQVKDILKNENEGLILWIIQKGLITLLTNDSKKNYLITRFHKIQSNRKFSNVAIFQPEASKNIELMSQVYEIGFGVHFSAPDGACFIEVHKPEGIVVGMCGDAFKGNRTDGIDIDSLIYDIAEYKKESDNQELYKIMIDYEFHFPISVESTEQIAHGSSITTNENTKISMPRHKLPNGMNMIGVYTRTSEMKSEFAGITGKEALEMVLKCEDVEGLMVINKNDSWMGITKEGVKNILDCGYA